MRVWTKREATDAGGAWLICVDRKAVAAVTDWPGTEYADAIVDACNAAERHRPRRYAVSKDGKMVREVTVLEGESVPLAQGESLGPHPSEIGEQFIYGR